MRSETDTRDLLQDVFCKIAANPELLFQVRDHRAFLLRLAHNQAIDLIRRRHILQTANAIRQSDTPEKQHAGVSWWKNWLWPRPLAWGALASVWLLILASGLITAAADKNTAQGQSLAQNHAAASSFLEQRA